MDGTHFLREKSKKFLLPLFIKLNVPSKFLLFFRIFFAFVTGVLLFFDNALSLIFLIAYQFVFLVDYVDGPLARLRKEFSPKLNRVDRVAHSLTSALFLLAVTVALFLRIDNLYFLAIGLVGVFSIISSVLLEWFWTAKEGISLKELKERHKISTNKQFLFYNFIRIDGPFTLFFFLKILNLDLYLLIFFGILNFLILGKKVYSLTTWITKKN
ncbi:MAG: CDP-alcohol phosphatidyltransferase family protein [Candidatus Pacearchaeota archaeon]